MSDYLIIGPTKSGKTGLLATLAQASWSYELTEEGTSVRVLRPNPAMSALADLAQGTIREGMLPMSATNEVIEYEFTLHVQRRKVAFLPWPTQETEGRFSLWDGPGGALFPNPTAGGASFDIVEYRRFRDALVESLTRASGLMLCLDSTDNTRALEMFEALPGIMRDTGLATLPCKRVAVCLTKVDSRFADKGTEARATAERESPQACCRSLLPSVIFRVLSTFCADAQFGFGWTSVYGFTPDGSPNYDEANQRLAQWELTAAGANAAIERWVPFRVIDPFLWLATGTARDLEVYAAGELPHMFAPSR